MILHMNALWEHPDAKSRSITAENPDGSPGGGARFPAQPGSASSELGDGWKTRPSVHIAAGETFTAADVEGPGIVRHIWMTCLSDGTAFRMPWQRGAHPWRDLILRMYWDGQENPSVECPLGDFFANGWGRVAYVSSAAVCVNPGNAMNCYWQMPFRTRCRITLENRAPDGMTLYYQIDYSLQDLPEDVCFFHAQFRRSNPTQYKTPHVILDGVEGKGQYVGTYLCWGSNSPGWWGEGEVRFFLDGDTDHPTICGTGTEDYFCGSYNFEDQETHRYREFCTPYAGLPQVLRPDGLYQSQMRFGMYRWHLPDPISFEKRIRVDVQALGWTEHGKFKSLSDDVASAAFWYQTLPTAPFPPLAAREELEV
ncbi:MAG: DUF2961 domain-containing protein [Clostridia bacterium]|nr:DUF2961 domain-containing protein [Clostridia bacterium]